MAASSSSTSGAVPLVNADDKYSEGQVPCFAPLVFFLPFFWWYSVSIDDKDLTFGYLSWCFRARVARSLIDKSSIETGSSTCMENLTTYGGWGIRMGPGGLTVYNPANGPWVRFKMTSGRAYLFSTINPEKVAAILRQ